MFSQLLNGKYLRRLEAWLRKGLEVISKLTLPKEVNNIPRFYYAFKLAGRYNKPGDNVLDAACGKGEWSCKLAKNCRMVVGVDISQPDILLAKATIKKAGLENVRLVVADLRHLPFRHRVFERVYSIDSLEHIDYDQPVIEELARVVKPGGDMYISVPYESTASAKLFSPQRLLRKIVPNWLKFRGRPFPGINWLDIGREEEARRCGHLRFYSPTELMKKVQGYFDCENHRYANNLFATLAFDLTWGVKVFHIFENQLLFIATRMDWFTRWFQKKGYLLIMRFKRNSKQLIEL